MMNDLIKGLGNLIGKFGTGPEISDTITRQFEVDLTPTITVRNPIGTTRVEAAGEGQVTVEAVRRVRGITNEATQSSLDDIEVNTTQEGSAIRVEVRIKNQLSNRVPRVDLVLRVPAAATLDVTQNAGNVEITGIQNRITARVDAGNLEVKGTRGTLTAQVSAGNIEASDVSLADGSRFIVSAGRVAVNGGIDAGASLSMRVDAGRAQVTLPASTGARLEATAEVGNISVSGWSVPISRNVTSARASGTLGGGGGALTIHVSIGDITLVAR
jgi:hypothetical protein